MKGFEGRVALVTGSALKTPQHLGPRSSDILVEPTLEAVQRAAAAGGSMV